MLAARMQDSLYEEPWDVKGVEETWFYHCDTLPGVGEVGGDWDLRECAGAYLGNYDFAGTRVLDVGAASGFLTFEMERRGASVVSFDLDDGANWDIVPHHDLADQLPSIRAHQSGTLVALKKAYWLAHRAHKSSAKAHYGNVYSIDDGLGDFDVVYYGMIVGHLRDVYLALCQGASRCTKAMLITSIFEIDDQPSATFMPSGARSDNLGIKSWWSMTTGLIKNMLGTLGFEVLDLVESTPLVKANDFRYGPVTCQTIVAERVRATPAG